MVATDCDAFSSVAIPTINMDSSNGRQGSSDQNRKRLTLVHDINDVESQRYICQENLLYCSLAISMMMAITLSVVTIFLRHGGILSILVNTLSKMLLDDPDLQPLLKQKNPVIRHYFLDDRDTLPTRSDQVYIGRWAWVLTDWAITACILIISTSIAGFLAIHVKSSVFVMVFMLFNVGNIVIETYIGVLLLTDDTIFHQKVKEEMIDIMQKQYNPFSAAPLSRILNTAMAVGRCCGIQGPQDMLDGYNITLSGGGKNILVHDIQMCCTPGTWKTAMKFTDTWHTQCSIKGIYGLNENLHREGCYNVWNHLFLQKCFLPIIVLISVIVALQALQIIIGVVILKWTNFVERDLMESMKNEEGTVSPSGSNNVETSSGVRKSGRDSSGHKYKFGRRPSHYFGFRQ